MEFDARTRAKALIYRPEHSREFENPLPGTKVRAWHSLIESRGSAGTYTTATFSAACLAVPLVEDFPEPVEPFYCHCLADKVLQEWYYPGRPLWAMMDLR